MALNTQFAGMPWLTQPADPIDSLAKGASAGGQIASTMARRRAEGMQAAQMEATERQREISNDIRRKEVSALLTWRQAQASKETAKLEAAAEKAASEKMFWDVVGGGMDQWRLANPDAPMEKEREQFQSLVARNWHMRGSGQAIPAPLLKAPPAPMAQPTEFESGGGKFVTGPKGQIVQVKPPPVEKPESPWKPGTVWSVPTGPEGGTTFQADEKGHPQIVGKSGSADGGKKTSTAAEKNLATAQQLKKEFESATPENQAHAKWMFESFSRMAHITDDPKQSVEQKLKVADALGQIRALRANDALFNKPGASQAQIDAIINQFSPGDESAKSAAPNQTFQSFEQWRQQRKAQNAK